MSRPLPVEVIQALLSRGVREFIVCAGARNSGLIVVLATAGEKVRLWQHFEERAAAFFALGRIRATGRPVAVVTTSGTAVAELLPAIIEAHYEGLPLVALTADRPRSFRGSGAPQAIEQAGLFHRYVSHACDLEEESPDLAAWDAKGPLHLNVCLHEPDSHTLPGLREAAARLEVPNDSPQTAATSVSQPHAAPDTRRLVLAGELLDHEIAPMAELALAFGAPVCAEAASGFHSIPALQDRLLHGGDSTLRHLPVTSVLRVGGVPSWRYWRDLEDRPDITVCNASRSAHPGLARKRGVSLYPDYRALPPNGPAASAESIFTRDTILTLALTELLDRFPFSEPGSVRWLSREIPEGATVLTGNSLAVREWNLCAARDRRHRVHVLRGANGIDGNLSAFLGIAADQPESWCLAGDLTTLYDLAAPWMLAQLPPGRRRFVVMQNGGGKIFSRLPSLRGLTPRERALMENPHTTGLKPWADLWNMDYVRIDAEQAIPDSLGDHAVIEIIPDPVTTSIFWEAWSGAVTEAWS